MSEKIELIGNKLIQELQTLSLPTEDFAIFGNAPMAANGLMDFSKVSDLDVIARGSAWEKAKSQSSIPPKETDLKFGDFLGFFPNDNEFDIQIYTGWPHGNWNIDELIDNADVIDGLRFVKLENVLKWKKTRNRPKDAEQIIILEEYFRGK
jgi:hypothetical protein